ncbi:MAG: aldehyde dehydrogenase [Pelagibacterales bacterium]|jgi:thiamine pyrophosphate-dependent acetolactate synthase large subunit-like protein|nr:aldehyde dehydrogenase [Pelagibacterales bacterium]MCH2678180.1 thiamine pyrophosphate-dependent enzyme [Alphaproteobacteria bacterium]|tara:strand:+ start:8557 stop:9150 length:594 start_codon:yes stop_codon:yes gene_type:complete
MSKFKLNRRLVISELLKERENSLIVNGLGGTCWDVASLGDNDLNFYVWGGMGNACMIGLGLALSQPDKKVIVITGDGEMLMGIGSLATIALKQPKNLSIVVFDNELYGETGNQKTHTAYCTNLSKIAIGSGIINSSIILTQEDLLSLSLEIHQIKNLSFSVIKINQDQEEIVLPIREGAFIKSRFRRALLGEKILLE